MLLIAAALALLARDYVRRYPQDVPWTNLDLRDPIGRFTSSKLTSLRDEPRHCRSLLRQAGVEDPPAPPREAGPDCRFEDGVFITADGAREAEMRPQPLVTSCPVAAGMFLLEDRVLQRVAIQHLGSRVTSIDHAGSYSCRRLYGREEGPFSEHATANAIDITGFRLEDGRRVSVLRDWSSEGPEAAFLRDVRDGACDLFATVLSPDYNPAHADHLHLDMANRGQSGWTLCR